MFKKIKHIHFVGIGGGFPDPILYGHLVDTLNGQIHILLYILNDPDAPRFDVDKMPDGSPTRFGIFNVTLKRKRPPCRQEWHLDKYGGDCTY